MTYNDSQIQVVTTADTACSDYLTKGIYYFASDYAPTDIPVGVNGWLIVIPYNNSSSSKLVRQIWMRHGSTTNAYQTFFRNIASTWTSDWMGMNAAPLSTTDSESGTTYSVPFLSGYSTNYNSGLRYYTLYGTESALGRGDLSIGNATAEGTEDNKYASLTMYGPNSYRWCISGQKGGITEHRYLYLPEVQANSYLVAANSTDGLGSATVPMYITSKGVAKACTSISLDVTGNATTATTATKLGSSTVGSGTKPIYLSSGTATASSSTVGTEIKPIYMSSGTLTAGLPALTVQSVTTASTKCSDYTTLGIYYFTSTYTPTDIPSGSNGWLIVLPQGNSTGTSVKQLWYRAGTPTTNSWQTYERFVSGDTVGDWRRFVTENEIQFIINTELDHGYLSITPSAANTPTGATLTYSTSFSSKPQCVCTLSSNYPGTVVLGVGCVDRTITGCTIYVTRTNTTATGVSWIAIYQPGRTTD